MKDLAIGTIVILLLLPVGLSAIDLLDNKRACELAAYEYMKSQLYSRVDQNELKRRGDESERKCEALGLKVKIYQSMLQDE